MNSIRRPVDGRAGVSGPQPGSATPSEPAGPQPAAQAPFGLTRQSARKQPADSMAPRNGQLPGVRLQPGNAGRKPLDPLPHVPPQAQAQAQARPGRPPVDLSRLYRQLNLKVTEDTRPAYTNADLLARPTKLGSGGINGVFAVQLKKPDGTKLDGIFKPLDKVEKGRVAKETGISQDDPQIAMRNIATLAYAQKLGIDVIPDTRVAVLDIGPGQVEGPKPGLVMERARGKPAAEAHIALFNRADVCAEVTKLQLLDHLTGQVNRDGNNYFIDIGPDGKAKVTGIDNDLCFGPKIMNPNGIRGTSLPPVVDTEMADKIHSLTHDEIRAMLGNRLSEAEVHAAIARHEGIKEHINVLAKQGRIIQPSDWGRPAITKLLTAENSYVGREREYTYRTQTPSPSQAGAGGLTQQPNTGWRAKPAGPQASTTARPRVPPQAGQPARTPGPVKTNPVQPQARQQAALGGWPAGPLQVQNPSAYPVNVRLPRAGKPPRQAQQHTLNVPAGTPPANLGRLYRELNLKVTEDTRPAYTSDNLMSQPTKLGSGAFNTVFAVQLKKPDGTNLDGVFKPLGKVENGWVAWKTGVPRRDPQIAMRNIATLSYSQKLGIDVIPDTRVAVLDIGPGQAEGSKLGLVMERARGKPGADAHIAVFNRPDVCAELTKLQMLDHLTGQGDRHGYNYFVDIGPDGKAKVTGIDNDQCFGSRITDPNGIRYAADAASRGFRGTSLPPVVDTEMAAKIHSLTHDDIREMLGNKLSEAEVLAAIARHEGVKEHIDMLARRGRIIQPSDWGRPAITKLLTAENSYVGRERELAPLMPRQPNAGW